MSNGKRFKKEGKDKKNRKEITKQVNDIAKVEKSEKELKQNRTINNKKETEPSKVGDGENKNVKEEVDEQFIKSISDLDSLVTAKMYKYQISDAITEIFLSRLFCIYSSISFKFVDKTIFSPLKSLIDSRFLLPPITTSDE